MCGAKEIKAEFEIQSTKFIGTKFSNGYEEIINDFQNAKQIRILTYGMPTKDSAEKLKILRVLENKDIRIIVGFASLKNVIDEDTGYISFDEYTEDSISKELDRLFDVYRIEDFASKPRMEVCFKNHAKIIGTENMVYVGSANYTTQSDYNYEAGVIVFDKDSVGKIYTDFFDCIDTVPCLYDQYDCIRVAALYVKDELEVAVELIESIIKGEIDNRDEDMSTIRECCRHIKLFYEMIKNMRRMNEDDALLVEISQILDEETIAKLDKEANEDSTLNRIITISDEQLSYELEDDYRESLGLPIHVDYPLSISEDEEYVPLCNESEEKKYEVIRNLWPGIIENDYTVLSFRDNLESMLYQLRECISLCASDEIIEEYKDRVMEIGTDSSIKK